MSVQATFAATLVDEWIHHGVTDAVVSPGSRSTPLALALAARLRVHVRLDERSAGFYAVGLSLASGHPTIVCTTSGTAAAELHAAVVEAHHARVPIIVCTADRPPELHHVGASQTIDQVGIFTTATRWACAPGVPDADQRDSWRPLATRAFAEALLGPHGPGPVHLNLAFREPLVGVPDALPDGHGPALAASPSAVPPTQALTGRGVIVAGGASATDPVRLTRLGAALGWPVLADPLSGCRVPGTIAAADAIVRSGVDRPETVVLLGTPWLSKALGEYIAQAASEGARVVVVDPWWRWVDPTRVVSELIRADPDAWIEDALLRAEPTDPEWSAQWLAHEERAQQAIESVVGDNLSEPMVARRLYRHASANGARVVVAASMPMRDLEWFSPTVPEPPRVWANRGANGIDGVVSTALGVASAGRQTYAFMGDLAFLHDVSGLVNLPDVPCTFVVLDNRGGGIFSFLPQAHAVPSDQFELLFGTPPTSDIGLVAQGFGLRVTDVTSAGALDAALREPPPVLLRVKVPGRADNAALHDSINQAVRRAIG